MAGHHDDRADIVGPPRRIGMLRKKIGEPIPRPWACEQDLMDLLAPHGPNPNRVIKTDARCPAVTATPPTAAGAPPAPSPKT